MRDPLLTVATFPKRGQKPMSDYRTGRGSAGYYGGEADSYGTDVYGASDYGTGMGRGRFSQGRSGGMRRGGGNSQGDGSGTAYQMAPLVVGGLMAALGLKRGGWLGYGIALAGLGVMQQSFSGRADIYEWVGMGDKVDHEGRAVTVSHAVTINKPASELYRYWRDFSNLPTFMENLERIEVIDRDHSRWTAKGPAGLTVSWEAEVTDDRPDSRIAWRSKQGADVPNWGHVEFRPAPTGQGTEVHAVIRYEPPAGMLGRAVAKLLGREPQQQMKADLARFKRMMETGQGSLHASNSMAGA